MTLWLIVVIVMGGIIGFCLWFFRLKRPDELILLERKGKIILWKRRIFPRKLCLVLPSTIHSIGVEVNTQARGKLDIMVRLSISFFADRDNIENLIKVCGWTPQALEKAGKELQASVQGFVGEIVEPMDAAELSREIIHEQIIDRLKSYEPQLGVKVTSVTVYCAEATDRKIADTLRKREEARLQEETEKAIQASRLAQALAKVEADEKIAEAQHSLAMKELDLRKESESATAELAKAEEQQALERRRLQLEVEREEIELLRKNPNLLLLAPQVTKLVEASQSLKNAETVVSISADLLSQLPQPLQQLFAILTDQKANKKLDKPK